MRRVRRAPTLLTPKEMGNITMSMYCIKGLSSKFGDVGAGNFHFPGQGGLADIPDVFAGA
jgi:hypothetical protein